MSKIAIIGERKYMWQYICDFFQERGHTLYIGADQQELIKFIGKGFPVIVLYDFDLRKKDWLTLLQDIKKRYNTLKVIAVWDREEQLGSDQSTLGFDEVVRKPFTSRQLETVVMHMLQEMMGF